MKKTPLKKQSPKKAPQRTADRLWSQLVRMRAGHECEWCGRSGGKMDAHHIFTREAYHVRHHPDNGVCLCYQCHVGNPKKSAHQTPDLFERWIREQKGDEWYDNFRDYTRGYGKPDYQAEILWLREELKKWEKRLRLTAYQ